MAVGTGAVRAEKVEEFGCRFPKGVSVGMEVAPKDKVAFVGDMDPDGAFVGVPDFFQAFHEAGAQAYFCWVQKNPIYDFKEFLL
jgi:hypothetical protein